MKPNKEEYVKFGIDGVQLRDIERFDSMARECFPDSKNPRKDAWYSLYWYMRSIHDLTPKKNKELLEQAGDKQ